MHNPKLPNIQTVLLPTVLLFPHVLILWWGCFPLLWWGERLGGPSCGPPSWLHSLSRAALLSCIILPFVAILLSVFFDLSKSTFPVGITSLLWGGGNWSECGLLVHIHTITFLLGQSQQRFLSIAWLRRAISYLNSLLFRFWCIVRVCCLHTMHYILFPYDSPWLAHWGLSFICSRLCVACCCVCFRRIASHDYSGMLLQSYEQFHTTGR